MKFLHAIWGSLSILLGCASGPSPSMEVHLIPAGYTGQVLITFLPNDSQVQASSSSENTYTIGKDGTAHIDQKMRYGIKNNANTRFYYVNDQGEKTRQIKLIEGNESAEDLVIIGPYPVGHQLYYFVDAYKNKSSYKNPAISGEERKQ